MTFRSSMRRTHRAAVAATSIAVCATAIALHPASAQPDEDPLLNPLPDPRPSTLGIEVEELVQLPESETTPATEDERLVRHNRINFIGEVPDGSERMFVPDLNGMMYLVEDDGSYVEYLDVRAEFEDHFHNHAGLGTGFGFVEFHPDFAENGIFYTVHTESGEALEEKESDFPTYGGMGNQGIVTEWTANDPSAETFEGTSREVMRIGFAGRTHGIQQIGFNPTAEKGDEDYGLLYMLVGDGGNGVDNDNPQDLSTPHGTIFRIDPLGSNSDNGQYGVPSSNPFVDNPDALGEIYAVGMRDPHRMAWDPAGDNRMFMGHIGEWQVESVYEVRPGDNFGWSDREGPFLTEDRQIYPLPDDDERYGYTYPVAAYDHNRDPGQTGDAGIAVSGGQVYRGDIPELQGRYLFTDIVRGYIHSSTVAQMRQERDALAPIEELKVFEDGQETTFQELVGDERVDLRYGVDAEGELYLLAKASGQIWKITGAREVPDDGGAGDDDVLPRLRENLVAHYDFDNPHPDYPMVEQDQGRSGTDIDLLNGKEDMRVADEAYPGAGDSLRTQQLSPDAASSDDWKAGIYDVAGIPSLREFNATDQMTVMGWFKATGENPGWDTTTDDPDDRYNAVGLAGVLSGDSDGHGVRGLLEVIEVDGELKVVALGRRVDGEASWTFAADKPWDEILVPGQWVHLAATFDYDDGEMQLFMNGQKLDGEYTSNDDPWDVGDGESTTSPTDPAGIKIGGSYPQNTAERNPCNCVMDDLMFLDSVPTDGQIRAQYSRFGRD